MSGAQSNRYLVITGCSSGIGRFTAVELAKNGWHVLAGVRRQEDADSLVQQQPDNLTPVLLDIASDASVSAACQTISTLCNGHGVQALINNAGVLLPGPLECIKASQLTELLEVNTVGPHRLTAALLPQLRQAASAGGAPRVVFVSSISGGITPPFFGAYAASKHALESIAEAYRQELLSQGIKVSVVQPDSVATNIWDKASSTLQSVSQFAEKSIESLYTGELRNTHRQNLAYKKTGLPTQLVVRSIMHAVNHARPKPYYRVGWRTTAALAARSFLPTSWMDYILRKSIGG